VRYWDVDYVTTAPTITCGGLPNGYGVGQAGEEVAITANEDHSGIKQVLTGLQPLTTYRLAVALKTSGPAVAEVFTAGAGTDAMLATFGTANYSQWLASDTFTTDAVGSNVTVHLRCTTTGATVYVIGCQVTKGEAKYHWLPGRERDLRTIQLKLTSETAALSTGDGAITYLVPLEYHNARVVDVAAMVSTVSSSGAVTYQVRNVTDSVDILSTAVTIDAAAYTSYTAATPAVINTSYALLQAGDIIAIDKDTAGTGELGDTVNMTILLPE
jgi:hypothetical protein